MEPGGPQVWDKHSGNCSVHRMRVEIDSEQASWSEQLAYKGHEPREQEEIVGLAGRMPTGLGDET